MKLTLELGPDDPLELFQKVLSGLANVGVDVSELNKNTDPFIVLEDSVKVTDELIEAVSTSYQKVRKLDVDSGRHSIFSAYEIATLTSEQSMFELVQMSKSGEIYQFGKVYKHGNCYKIHYLDRKHQCRSVSIPNKWENGKPNSAWYATGVWKDLHIKHGSIGYNEEITYGYSSKVCHATCPREETTNGES